MGNNIGDINKAWHYMQEGEILNALEEAKKVIDSDPYFYDAQVLCGEINTSNQDFVEAERYLNKAINFNPHKPDAYMRLAWVKYYQNQINLTLDAIKKTEEIIIEKEEQNNLIPNWIKDGIKELKRILLTIEQPSNSNQPLGTLIRAKFEQKEELASVSTYDLCSEIAYRLTSKDIEQNISRNLSQESLNLFSYLSKLLSEEVEVFDNRFSLTWLECQFCASRNQWSKQYQIPLKNATYVEIGSGAINPFSFMFLHLMLGAKKCFCLEPDNLVDESLSLKNLAEIVGKVVINPKKVCGDYPITPYEILENISSFNLDLLSKGDYKGLDSDKLIYLKESLINNSIPDETADVTNSVSVLEHLTDLDSSIQEIRRLTKIGGYGLHNIDGIDHEYYQDSSIHPLEFLKVETDSEIVGVCNRIRPLEFKAIFERNGFEVLEIRPYGKMEVSEELRESFVEPFRSMSQEFLEVTQAYFLVKRVS